MDRLKKPLGWAIVTVLLVVSGLVSAVPPGDKPFAERKVVLQISDQDEYKQTLVLNVASNLIRHYGPDRVDVEIVAFGPGLHLMFADNSNAGRIDSLSSGSGIRFSACDNTLSKMIRKLGHTPVLNPGATHVSSGVVRILDLVDQGYTLVKP